jgi:outer membrane immunogenic protein
MRRSVGGSLIAAALFLGSPAVSSAADLPQKAPSMIASVSAFSWTGFYIGANVGYGWGKFDGTSTITGNTVVGTTSTPGSVTMNGINGGGQLGYNWQTGALVLGIEGDFQGSGERHSSTMGCGVGCTFNSTTKLDSFATVRGRLGWTPFDRGLIYVTGGWAWMHGNNNQSLTAGGVTATLIDMTASKSGWTIGGGYEQMLWDRWSAKIEYLYMQADSVTGTSAIPAAIGGGTFTTTGRMTNNVVRLGANYHFKPAFHARTDELAPEYIRGFFRLSEARRVSVLLTCVGKEDNRVSGIPSMPPFGNNVGYRTD